MSNYSREVKLEVLGVPIPKARPRIVRPKNSNRVIAYTPKTTVDYMQAVRAAYREKYSEMVFGHHEPLCLLVTFYLPKPKSIPKKRRSPCVKPDVLNLAQSVQDALSGFAYPDDAAIVSVIAHKCYGYPPQTVIEITVAGEEGQGTS